jgi:CDGSH-type Zn-finger protein/uncharacterized Fe-S cluster protein YjdI
MLIDVKGSTLLPNQIVVVNSGGAMDPIEVVRSESIELRFEARRCIHSRGCVLGRPDVFVPNVSGAWLHPERASAAEIAELAHNCPSGAIQYRRLDGGPEERAPKVNLVRIRENGPLAFQADLRIAGQAATLRATLCRCGASRNKPYCDGSHSAAGFQASGEPAVGKLAELAQRDGPVEVTPARDGPLVIKGAIEVVSGTGRTIGRMSATALCRCGGSSNKPYCDGTHSKIGFRSD